MKKKTYSVSLQVLVGFEDDIIANSEEEAKQKAIELIEMDGYYIYIYPVNLKYK